MVYEWPSGRDFQPISGKFHLATVAQFSASPYTGAGKALTLAQIWRAEIAFNAKSIAVAQDMQGFIESLEGPVNPVRLYDWWRSAPALLSGNTSFFSDGSGFTDGTGFTDGYEPQVVVAAARGDRRLHVSGLPAGAPSFLRGDLIGLRHDLGGGERIRCVYEVKAGVTANADGEALINILPGLRAGCAEGDAVTLWRPTMQMRLMPDHDAINRAAKWSDAFTLSFVEDIP